jgi:hypothetical protein
VTPRSPTCPLCGSEFHIKNVDFESPFRCPACAKYLYVPPSYARYWVSLSLIISALVCFALGARGFRILIASVLVWIPILLLVVFYSRHFSPPRLKPFNRSDSGYSGPLGLGPKPDGSST